MLAAEPDKEILAHGQKDEQMAIKIHYSPDGIAVSDFKIEQFFSYIKNASGNPYPNFKLSTENIFLRLRVAVAKGEMPHGSIVFIWQGQEVPMDEDGRIEHWSDGFLDTHDKLLDELLGV